MKEIAFEKSVNAVKVQYGKVEIYDMGSTEYGGYAVLTQEINRVYPGKRMGNSLSAGLFDDESGQEFDAARFAIVKAPEFSTEQEKQAVREAIVSQLAKFPQACIQQTLTNNIYDVISEEEKYALEQGNTTMEALKARRVLQDSEGNIYNGEEVIGTVVKDENGRAVDIELEDENAVLTYRLNSFQREYVADKDFREKENSYTKEITLENASHIQA